MDSKDMEKLLYTLGAICAVLLLVLGGCVGIYYVTSKTDSPPAQQAEAQQEKKEDAKPKKEKKKKPEKVTQLHFTIESFINSYNSVAYQSTSDDSLLIDLEAVKEMDGYPYTVIYQFGMNMELLLRADKETQKLTGIILLSSPKNTTEAARMVLCQTMLTYGVFPKLPSFINNQILRDVGILEGKEPRVDIMRRRFAGMKYRKVEAGTAFATVGTESSLIYFIYPKDAQPPSAQK